MKNKIKSILIILITIAICLSVGVYAGTTLLATDVTYTKSDGNTVSVSAALDELRAGLPTKSIGDEVTVGGEQFYVLEWDNNSDMVRLISKYNLNKAGTAQEDAPNTTTNCAFSSTNYWKDDFTSSPFNLNDFIGFSSTDALGKAKSYGRSKGAVSSSLLSYDEASALLSKNEDKLTSLLNGKYAWEGWKNELCYWLGTANDDNVVYVWNYGSGKSGISTNVYASGYGFGVRPVITILKSNIS